MAGVMLQQGWESIAWGGGGGEAVVISVGRPDFYYGGVHQVNEASDTEN